MQEQNFEKQVQFKLEELSLTPSAPVWQKVENEIRAKKKRRRTIVFWLFPFLLGAGMFWSIQTFTNKKEHLSSKTATPNPKIGNSPSSNSLEVQSPSITSTKQTGPTLINNGSSSTEAAPQNQTVSKSTSASITTSTAKPILIPRKEADLIKQGGNQNDKSHFLTKTTQKPNRVERQKQNSSIPVNPEESESLVVISTPEQKATAIDHITEVMPIEQTIAASIGQPLEQIITSKEKEIKPVIISDSIQNKKGQEKVQKWRWATQASYGIASLQTSFLSKAFGTPLAYSDPQLNAGFPSTTPAPAAFQPAKIENGTALHAGFIAKRNINKRFAVTAGLQYSYLTLKSSVGQTVVRDTMIFAASLDRVLNQFYRPVQTGSQLQEYVNKYHFIELPVGIEWKINKRLPLHIQTGLSLSYLFKINALVYDPNAHIYYQNNDLFSKKQLQFFSSATYQVWQHRNTGIHIGPYLQYGLTSLEKVNKTHHLLSTGLKASYSF